MITATKVCIFYMNVTHPNIFEWLVFRIPQTKMITSFYKVYINHKQIILVLRVSTHDIARNKLKKVSSNSITANIMVEEKEDPPVTSSENITVTSDRNNRQERTLAILSDTPNLDEIIQYIKSNGFEIIATKKFEFTMEEAEEFYEDHAKQNYYEKCVRWLSRYVAF